MIHKNNLGSHIASSVAVNTTLQTLELNTNNNIGKAGTKSLLLNNSLHTLVLKKNLILVTKQ